MPVGKTNGATRKGEGPSEVGGCRGICFWDTFSGTFCKKILLTLVGILVVYATVLLGTMVRNNIKEYRFIGKADRMERTIMLQAKGKVTVRPDIAVTTMGFVANAKTVTEAQQKNTDVMNMLVTKLKQLGIAEEDIQTDYYNIYPSYNYTDKSGRELEGYEVSQGVSVKIRDLTKANQVLALAGAVGANNVSGLTFTIDDREVYQEAARVKAFEKIARKVEVLRSALGVNFVGVISYDEFEVDGEGGPIPLYARAEGGETVPPTIESGTKDVVMQVTVTLEIEP